MRQLYLYLGLTLLYLAGFVSGVDLKDLITFQPGTTFGGCDARAAVLEQWHQEAIDSLDNAIVAIEKKYNENSDTGKRVRKAMFDFFRVPNRIGKNGLTPTAQDVSNKLFDVQKWFNGLITNVPKDSTFLFCNSNFLVLKNAATDPALDYLGNPIVVNGKTITISGVAAYADDLVGGNVPWWSGDHAPIKGYYFTAPTSGGNYCNGKNLGLTATLKALKADPNGGQPQAVEVQTMTLCPYAFDNSLPNTYADAMPLIKEGTSLGDVLPKSTTLLHEVFHLIFGDDFLQGDPEIYGLAECIDAAKKNAAAYARINPENYVYFVASMHYLTGTAAEGVTTNWDFTGGPDSAKTIS